MFQDQPVVLSPASFFDIEWDCYPARFDEIRLDTHSVPDFSFLVGEILFARVAMAWDDGGLSFLFVLPGNSFQSFYPQFDKGDSIELFIDTRNIKHSNVTTRFSHHFYFLIQENEADRGEITRFRTEDRHKLAESHILKMERKEEKGKTSVKLFIPKEALHGYDPQNNPALGFTYKINRYKDTPQHFIVTTQEYPIDQNSRQWSSVKLINKIRGKK